MGRAPCCEEAGVKKGPWTPEEDKVLVDYIQKHGHGSWRRLPKLAGLNRCGKSCRLRWTNYLRPDIKRGRFSDDEEKLIIHLHSMLGNKWSSIATKLPGRTDNEIKNYWNTHLRKKLLSMGIDPVTHRPRTDLPNLLAAAGLPGLLAAANLASGGGALGAHWDINNALKLQADAANLAKIQLLQGIFRALAATAATAAAPPPSADLVSLLSANINGAGQLPGVDQRGQYDGLVNLPVLTSAAPAAPGLSFAGFLDSFGGGSGGGAQAVAGDGLSSTELGHGGASCSNLTATVPAVPAVPAPAPALVAVGSPEDCNAGGSGGGASCEGTPASSPFDGLESLNLDELNTDGGWKDLLEQMSWLNSP